MGASLDGDQLISILLSQCIWNNAL